MSYFKKNDIIIIIIIVVISVGMMATYYVHDIIHGQASDGGDVETDIAVITVDGVVYKEAPLSLDAEYTIESKGNSNTIRVEGNRVFMLDASCPDKSCVKQGSIPENTRVIVCLPNKVIIKLKEGTQTGASEYRRHSPDMRLAPGENMDSMDSTESTESTENSENPKSTENPYSTSNLNRADSVDSVDSVYSVDSPDSIDSIDSIDSEDSVDSVDNVDKSDRAGSTGSAIYYVDAISE